MKKNLFLLVSFVLMGMAVNSQKMPVSYDFGEKYRDRYRYSNLVTIDEDDSGGYILVRAYYQGLILKPKGYLIEKYNSDLELVSEYNYKLKGLDFVNGFLKNGQLNLLFLNYNEGSRSYEYWVHTSPIIDFNFKEKKLLSIASEPVNDPVGKNYYNRDFSRGFTTAILFDEDKKGFVISTHHKRGKSNKHMIHMFDTALNKKFEYDFSDEIEEKNYAFENIAFSSDLKTAYIVGKAYFKKRRFRVDERKFQYELIKVSQYGYKSQSFVDPGKYPEALYPVLVQDKLVCVGKSHWVGGMNNGHFSVDHGKMTNQLAMMYMKLCERYGTRANWRGYTYNDEMQSQALMQLSQIGLQFDESKSDNPFAYYTAAITNSFTRILNIEKKNQSIRDDLLEFNGMMPSFTRQNENETAGPSYKKKMKTAHGEGKIVNKTGIAKLNKVLKKKGKLESDDFDEVNYKKVDMSKHKAIVKKKW